MKKMNLIKNNFLLSVVAIVCCVSISTDAFAWRCQTCDGAIHAGLHSNKTFRLDRFSIFEGSAREDAVLDAMEQWNALDGMSDRLEWTDGSNTGTVTYRDDISDIAFAKHDASVLDGAAGGAAGVCRRRYRPCGPTAWVFDGRLKEADIWISDAATTDELSPTSTRQGVRTIAIHEFGHALGMEHDSESLTTMNLAAVAKLGNRNVHGNTHSRVTAESTFADDAHFGYKYHGSSSDGYIDPYVSPWGPPSPLGKVTLEWFQDDSVRPAWMDFFDPVLLNTSGGSNSGDPMIRNICWGTTIRVNYGWGNKGKKEIHQSDPVESIIVLSTNSTISNSDQTVLTMNHWGKRGFWKTGYKDVAIPETLPNGRYYVGIVIDPTESKIENEEYNNSVYLNFIVDKYDPSDPICKTVIE